MVKFISAERMIDELHDRMIVILMCRRLGDDESAGKYKGFQEAVKIASDLALRRI